MARLPSEEALGPLPSGTSNRPIASADLTGYAKGAQAIAEGAQNLGKGIQQMASLVAHADRAAQAKDDELDVARFNAEWTTSQLQTNADIKGSNVYLTPDGQVEYGGGSTGAGAGPVTGAAGIVGDITGQQDPALQPTDTHVNALAEKRDALLANVKNPQKQELLRYKTDDDLVRTKLLATARTNTIVRDRALVDLDRSSQSVITGAINSDDPQANAEAIRAHYGLVKSYVTRGWLTNQQALEREKTFQNDYGLAYADAMSRKGKLQQAIDEAEEAARRAGSQKPADGPRSDIAPAKPLDIARTLLGKGEVQHRDTIAQFIGKVGGSKVDPAVTPWCAGFVNGVLRASGAGGTDSLAARSFLNYGTPTNKPTEGDIVVLSRGSDPSKGHVGFYVGEGSKPGTIKILGGNQSDSVSEQEFSAARVLGYRQIASGDVGKPLPEGVAEAAPADAGQPYKVASVGGVQAPAPGSEPQAPAPTGEQGTQLAQAVLPTDGRPQSPKIVFDYMDPLPREKLLKQMIQQRDTENVRKSTAVAEGFERKILDAQAGRGDLPTHEEIAAAPITDEGKRNTVIRQRDAAEGPIASYRSAFQRFVNKEAFNPYDTEERKNVDKIFGALGGDDVALQSVTSRTGILPESASTKMRADLISNDPKRVAGGMTRAANLIAANPNIMAKVEGGDDIEKNALKFQYFIDSYGMSAEEAANRIVREQTPEHKSAVNAIIKSEDIGTKVKKDLSVNDLAGAFDAGLGIFTKNPTVGTNVKTRENMMDQFAEMTVDNYKNSASGDWNVAKKLAAKQLSKTWGVSAVSSPLGVLGGGGILMPYPPEKAPAYQGIENAPEMIAKQAIGAIKAETGTDVERKSLRLDAIPGVTPEDYKAGRPPQYRLSWEDKDGILHMVNPGKAFYADPEAMKAQQTEQRRIGTEAGQAARQEAADKLATDPARNYIGKPVGDAMKGAAGELRDWNTRKQELMQGGGQ